MNLMRVRMMKFLILKMKTIKELITTILKINIKYAYGMVNGPWEAS